MANDLRKRNEKLVATNRALLRTLSGVVDVSPERTERLASMLADIAEEGLAPDLIERSAKLLMALRKSSDDFDIDKANEFTAQVLAAVSRNVSPEQYAKILVELGGKGDA